MKQHRYRSLTVMLLFLVLWLTLMRAIADEQNETDKMEGKGLISFEFPWSIEAKVEVNLTPKLINLASKSVGNTAEGSALLQMLDGIYVRTYDRTTVDERELVNYFRWKLKEDTWETLVKIEEDNETFEINLLFDEDKVYGIFVIVIPKTPEEVIFVNIVGKIAPERVEELLRNLGNFGVMDIDVRRKLRMQAVSTRRTGRRELLAVKVNYPPTIDGILDDACWKIAPQAGEFTQGYYENPVEDDSVVKVVYTLKAIYVGWYLYDSQPDKIVARRTRNRKMWGITEDWVSLSLDPFHTHQIGDVIWFLANPFGMTRVLIPSGTVDFIDRERMDRWTVAAKIVENGWVVEMEIPWEILNYPETTEPIWMGINFQRSQARTRMSSSWSNTGYPTRPEDDGHWMHVLPPPKLPDTQEGLDTLKTD